MAAFEKQLGLDRPIAVQFGDFLVDLVHLDFGQSLWQHRPAMEIVFEKLPLTMLLAFLGIGLAFFLAIPLGIVAALRPGGIADRVTVFLSLIGLSVPQFWLGLLLIVVFAVQLHWLPASVVATPAHMIMPAIGTAMKRRLRYSSSWTSSERASVMNTPSRTGPPDLPYRKWRCRA